MTEWKIQGSGVYGKGQSYNCHNKVTAEQLLNTLNNYETTKQSIRETEQKFDNITRKLIQIQMSLKILDQEINTLKQLVTE